jgi:TRAP-type uncharacterized transport system fused permease subunit
MAIHMFVFYWGMLSSITPPVAIASFAAAGIAGAPPMQTSWESMRVGSIIYFIPFFFVLNPAFVLQGPLTETLILTVTAALGIVFICGGIQGYQVGVGELRGVAWLEWPLRTLFIAGGLVLAAPGGGIMPMSHAEMAAIAAAILLPAISVAHWSSKRSNAITIQKATAVRRDAG